MAFTLVFQALAAAQSPVTQVPIAQDSAAQLHIVRAPIALAPASTAHMANTSLTQKASPANRRRRRW